jgi:hypothetical protein
LWPKQDVIPPAESQLAAASPIGHYGQSCKILSKNEKETLIQFFISQTQKLSTFLNFRYFEKVTKI